MQGADRGIDAIVETKAEILRSGFNLP